MEMQNRSEDIKRMYEAKRVSIAKSVAMNNSGQIVAHLFQGRGNSVTAQELAEITIMLAKAFEEYLRK